MMHPTKKYNTNRNHWKMSSITVISVLLFTILVIPALVVLPNTFQQTDQPNPQEAFPSYEEDYLTNEDDLAVQVLRTELDRVESVPIEQYVVGVVAAEMPADFELEALKAQALAARTYVVQYLSVAETKGEEATIKDTVQHQVYRNNEELQQLWGNEYHQKIKKVTQAVLETRGEILTYQNQPITPAFFSTSNGYTENSEDYWENELPYLKSVSSPWDQASPRFLDQKIIPIDQVEEALDINWNHANNSISTTRTESNRIKTIELAGKTFTGRQIREALELRSTDFTLKQKDNHLIFTTKGYGHGVGMSQYGANGMAQEGNDYREIVYHYYQGVEIDTIADATPKLLVQN